MIKSLLKVLALTISLSAILVVSCSKPDSGGGGYTPSPTPQPQPTPTPQPTEKIVVPSSVSLKPTIADNENETVIPFTASAPWTASITSATKADSWIDVNPKSGGAGSVSITITTSVNDSYESRIATIQIVCDGSTVTITITQEGKKKPQTINVSSVSLDKATLELTEDDTYTLTATIYPGNATNKKVSWSIDKSDIASIDQNGTVKALKAGTATVMVKTEDGGKTAICNVTVKAKGNIEDVDFENW